MAAAVWRPTGPARLNGAVATSSPGVPDPLPRLRQAVIATASLAPVVVGLRAFLGRWTSVPQPFVDPGVGRFGLVNAVLAIGDTFIEVLQPARPDTAVGRHLERRGGDAGYMAMFEVDDASRARRRLADLDVRVVWQADLPDAVDLHLHPKDVPGALVAVDQMIPPGSWRWGGPAFAGRVPRTPPGGLHGLTIAVPDPLAAARRWAAVLGLPACGVPAIELAGGRQRVDFVPATASAAGLVAITFGLPGGPAGDPDVLRVGSTVIEVRALRQPAGGGDADG